MNENLKTNIDEKLLDVVSGKRESTDPDVIMALLMKCYSISYNKLGNKEKALQFCRETLDYIHKEF